MFISSLKLTHFKNYQDLNVHFHANFNIVVGKNGMGKSNLLDAIYYLCFCKSNFQSLDKYLVKKGENFFRLFASLKKGEKNHEVVFKVLPGQKKECSFDASIYDKLSNHIGEVPCIIISPGDIQALLDGSESRRRLMDICISQYSQTYLKSLMKYNKILKSRNAYLKSLKNTSGVDMLLLKSYDEQMHPHAMIIFKDRKGFVEQLAPIFSRIGLNLSSRNEHVSILYSSKLHDQNYFELMDKARESDIFKRRTTEGPHRDDLKLEINNDALRIFGSQGQIKSYILALKLAQYELLSDLKKIKPILILDDIFDKLDSSRVHNLLSYIIVKNYGQVFISDTDNNRVASILLALKAEFKRFEIEKGDCINE